MVLVENDSFLSELTRLFNKSKTSGTGSLTLTMKRYDGRTTPKPVTPKETKSSHHGHHQDTEYKCLIRAQLGNKKISTVVNQKDVNKFQMAYANLLKANIDGLKKKAKAKSKTTKAT